MYLPTIFTCLVPHFNPAAPASKYSSWLRSCSDGWAWRSSTKEGGSPQPRLLLALVNSRSCGEFYTQELRPEDVQVMLASGKSEKSLWAMAQLAAEAPGVSPDDYLASVHKKLLHFRKKREDGSREVWDREQLLNP